jgi:hypothetical protein
MKKMMTVLFAGLFLLMAAGSAMAEHRIWQGPESNYNFNVGGQIEIDGWYKNNYPGTTDDNKWYNQETRLAFKGNWGDVEGQVRMEFDYDWDYTNQNKGNTTNNPLSLAWVRFPIPYTPLKLTAGLQSLLFGKSILLDDRGYALLVGGDFGGVTATVGTVKWTETYVVDKDFDSYLGILGSKVGGAQLAATFLYNQNNAVKDNGWWDLGLYADGSASAIKYWFEGHYQGGTVTKDVDLSAFGLAGAVTMALGPADLTLVGAYGSGQDSSKDVTAFQPVKPYWEPDIIVVFDLNGKSISNVWALAARATLKPAPKFTTYAQVGFYNYVEEKVKGADTFIGTEVDVVAKYQINDNCSWKLALGYLFAGDALGKDADNPISINNEFLVTF